MFNTLTFPETMEEFIEQYKVVKGENLYCDGVEFIPVFRMKEWVERLQPRKGKITYTECCEELWGESSICSLCGCSWQIVGNGNDNFCPNCGADLRPQFEEPEINPCRGCEDYDGKGGCKTKGGCADMR